MTPYINMSAQVPKAVVRRVIPLVNCVKRYWHNIKTDSCVYNGE
uniref:Uncharacterized protein n=1 Tax=Anguilla anguilla TaxID=7936 RepID=A0A0E9SPS6_ANGAN